MNFQYSKTREQKKAMIKENIEKQHRLIQQQNANVLIVDKKIEFFNQGLNQMEVEDKTGLNLPLLNPPKFENFIDLEKSELFGEKQESLLKRNYQGIILVNCYQFNYANGKATGFGDFLRGCYYLMQYCEEKKYTCQIDFSRHLLCRFVKHKRNYGNIIENRPIYKFTDINANLSVGINKEIDHLVKNNYDIFENFLEDQQILQSHLFFFTNSFPLYSPTKSQKERMRFLLEPTEEIAESCKQIMDRLELIKKRFILIHIRFGDEYLVENNKIFDGDILETVKREISSLLSLTFKNQNQNQKYLLLADNNEIKKYLIRLYPFFKTFFKEITHFGEGVSLEAEKVKNTMVDFYLMSCSEQIYSYSCYLHGSGFSRWCAKTYDIPYVSKYIK
jgi:hypothetical protein